MLRHRVSFLEGLLLYPRELRAPCAVGNLVTGLRLQQQPRVGAWSARPYPLGGASARPPMPTRRSRMRIARLVMPALVLALVPTLQLGDRSDQDPPSRVGRLSFLSGSVSFRPGSVDDWATATVNYPLTTGDHLWTDADARAEITIGSSAIRLASQSAFGVLALDDRTTQVRLSQGTLAVRLRHLGDDESFEIDTPNRAVSLLRPGSYRGDVDSSGDTATVTVRHGEAEVTANGSAFSVRADDA